MHLPGTGPHTRGIISKMAEHDGSSKHNCLASMQFKIAIAVLMFGPERSKKKTGNIVYYLWQQKYVYEKRLWI